MPRGVLKEKELSGRAVGSRQVGKRAEPAAAEGVLFLFRKLKWGHVLGAA